jgi:1-acyl-sn-glycerol-3-phosphate acyltransferase
MINRIVYRIGWTFFLLVYTIIYRRKITGLNNIPKNTGFIVASNHLSLGDPPLIGTCLLRPMYYMAKKELFQIPVFGKIISMTNAFPVDRGGSDPKAIRKSIDLLKNGNALLIFPQGGRRKQHDAQATKYKGGAGILSCWSKVPIVPCRIENSDKLTKFKKIKVTFFEPVYPPGKYTQEDYNTLTERVMEVILG